MIEKSLTVEQALALKYGDYVHYDCHCKHRYHKRTGKALVPIIVIEVWKVNGKVKRWKRTPGKFMVPIRRGLYTYDYITEWNYENYHLPEDCPFRVVEEGSD